MVVADLRLTPMGYRVGLIPKERYDWVCLKEELIAREVERVSNVIVGANAKVQALMEELNSTPLVTGLKLTELIRRPELNYELLAPLDPERPDLHPEVKEQVNIRIKYEGYIKRQEQQVKEFKRLEKRPIPEDFDYDSVDSLRNEAREKLKRFKPVSVGQAGRISGVSPADITMLLIALKN